MHRDELQVGLGRDEGEGLRESELQPHQPRQHQGHQADGGRRDRILDGDHLGVLAPDVFRDEAFRVIKLYILDFGYIVDGFGYYIGHHVTLRFAYLSKMSVIVLVPQNLSHSRSRRDLTSPPCRSLHLPTSA